LQAAKAEHQPAHQQQPLERQFEADREQQQGDAQLGDRGNLGAVGDESVLPVLMFAGRVPWTGV
jgi:hypothetical protein